MRGQRSRRLKFALFIGVAVAFTALALVGYATDALRGTDHDSINWRFDVRGKQDPPRDLVVVRIDDETFNDLRERWPFRRTFHARVIDRIARDDPKVIAFDVQFTEQSQGPRGEAEDLALAEAVANADGKVVLATTEVEDDGRHNVLGGDEVLKELGARAGNALLPLDPGGVNRRVNHSVGGLETFAVAGAEVAAGRQIPRSSVAGDGALIDYFGPAGTVPAVSFSRVHDGKLPRGYFKDKVVVVGPVAPSLQDLHPTSTDDIMSGAEIQASAISTALRDFPIEDAPGWLNVVLIVLLGVVTPLASLRLSVLPSMAIGLATGVVFLLIAQLLFNGGTTISVVYPMAALVLSLVGSLAMHLITTAFERERVRDVFSRFVPDAVVGQVLARTDEDLRLGGERLTATVMFSDLRGFTSFAERLPPDRVITILNRYLGEMSDAILDNGGTLVAYMGDGIMAVFGAPIAMDDHADRALRAARQMLLERLPAFNDYLREDEGFDKGFRMGIGLNTGPVFSGNVGSARRLEYTAIGDTTNTAARLEGMTKGTPFQLYVAESTRQALQTEAPDLEFVDEFEVRGREAKIRLYGLRGDEPAPAGASREPAAVT